MSFFWIGGGGWGVKVRALACPAVAALTVCEGACRGAGDLCTPVAVGLAAGLVNAVLNPLLMFPGTRGAS